MLNRPLLAGGIFSLSVESSIFCFDRILKLSVHVGKKRTASYIVIDWPVGATRVMLESIDLLGQVKWRICIGRVQTRPKQVTKKRDHLRLNHSLVYPHSASIRETFVLVALLWLRKTSRLHLSSSSPMLQQLRKWLLQHGDHHNGGSANESPGHTKLPFHDQCQRLCEKY